MAVKHRNPRLSLLACPSPPTPLLAVARDAADEPHVRLRVHEYLHVEQLCEARLGKDQDSLDQDHAAGLGEGRLGGAGVGGEVVVWDEGG